VRREPYDFDLEAVLQAAAALHVAVELNAQPDRLDLNDVQVRGALASSAYASSSAAARTSRDELAWMKYGIDQARRGLARARRTCSTP
jgi:DNA polymerase (family X)